MAMCPIFQLGMVVQLNFIVVSSVLGGEGFRHLRFYCPLSFKPCGFFLQCCRVWENCEGIEGQLMGSTSTLSVTLLK